jgi:hypothetical protein
VVLLRLVGGTTPLDESGGLVFEREAARADIVARSSQDLWLYLRFVALLKICTSWVVEDNVLGLATCRHGNLEVRWRSASWRSGGVSRKRG